jgi:hypothetical protein
MIIHIFKRAQHKNKIFFSQSWTKLAKSLGGSTVVHTSVDRAIFSSGAPYKLINPVDERNIIEGKITATPARVGGFTKLCISRISYRSSKAALTESGMVDRLDLSKT